MRRPLARLWIMVWAVTGGPPLEISSFAPSLRAKRSNPESRRGDSLDCFVASLLAMTRLLRRSRFASLLPLAVSYFIGQIASAIAACGGEMGTELAHTYCSHPRSTALFW